MTVQAESLQSRLLVPIFAFARLTFTDKLAYRVRYVIGVINYTIYMSVQYFLWQAVFASSTEGGSTMKGFTFEALITYFAIGWIVRVSYYNNLDEDLAERVNRGDIASDLLRPMPLLGVYYGKALGESSFRILFMALPTACVLFPLFSVSSPKWPSGIEWWLHAGSFVLSIIFAFHIFFFINFIVGTIAVYFERLLGVIWAKFVVLQFLSGLLVPFDFFPSWARGILEFLPFRAIVYSPAMIYLGKGGEGIPLKELGLQAFWTVFLLAFSVFFWRRARRRLVVLGG